MPHLRVVFLLGVLLIHGECSFSQAQDSVIIAKLNFKALEQYLSTPDSSIELSKKALSLAEANGFVKQQAFSYYVLSKAHWAKGNYQLSTKYAFKSLKFYENSSQIYHWGECLSALGRTFADQKDYALAHEYIHKGLSLAIKNNHEMLLAEVLREQSFLLLEEKKYDSSLQCINRAISIYNKYNDSVNISVLSSRKARLLFELGQLKESKEYIHQALLMDSLVKNRRGLGITLYQAGLIEWKLGNTEQALAYLKRSLRTSEELNNIQNIIHIRSTLADLYHTKNLNSQVIEELKKVSVLKDSLYSLEKNVKIQEMQAVYELEEKDHIIRLLEDENLIEKKTAQNQKILLLSVTTIMVLLGLLSYLFWRMRGNQLTLNKALAIKNQEIELQNEEIQSQSDSLHQINQLKSKILSVISHDLRGPIKNLYMLLEMVTKKIVTPQEFAELSVKLKSNLNVTQRTLENLLNWSMGQMEGIKTEAVAFNINSVIDDVAQLSEEAANHKQLLVKSDSKNPVFVLADINQVHLILRNLFNNAIKFSQRDGEVMITTEIKGKFCFISIQDNGIGMTQAEVDMILNTNEYFTKVGTDQEKGTGLGLLLCKDFIKRNGGEFSISSKLKEGTRVTFSLPLS
ncbi:MAG: tetratricopeptide repeat-containing sensor histidine kinase [Flammeovirgaceae bacterium]|nr:tetratricopeptide repeat-containing sensor histidine kinase [Flammeovirgaceae bacterium]